MANFLAVRPVRQADYPFCTNEDSGMGSSERDLKKICAGATVERGLAIRGCETAKSKQKIAQWAKGLV